jgi:hypothetical protein
MFLYQTSPIYSLINKNVIIRSTGIITTDIPFDYCDGLDNWKVTSSKADINQGDNTLEVDTTEFVQGVASLKMTWAATGSNYGGMFYKKPASGEPWGPNSPWDFSATPVLRMRFKADDLLPANMRLKVVTGTEEDPYAWNGFTYDIHPQVTAIGMWLTIEVDLRLPEAYTVWPCLTYVKQIAFELNAHQAIENPVTFWVDQIEVLVGSVMPLEAYIEPEAASVIAGDSATFRVRAQGGQEPYTYEWYVDNQLQSESLDTATFNLPAVGVYHVSCILTEATGSSMVLHASAIAMEPVLPTPESKDVYKSEVRGIFLHMWWGDKNLDLDLLAKTCMDYGINMVVLEVYSTHLYDGVGIKDWPLLRTAIDAFHRKGIKVHILHCVSLTPFPGMETLTNGGPIDWLDHTKPESKQMLRDIATTLARDYDIDGFMFDYIRWDFGGQMPLGDEAKGAFISWSGYTDMAWPDDVLSGGRYYWDFLQWRILPITEAVEDMRSILLSYKPDLAISAAVFPAFDGCGNYQVMRIGQHTADWVDRDLMDFISPMLYDFDPITNGNNLADSFNFYNAGPEGKVPTIPFLTIFDGSVPRSTDNYVAQVRQMKQQGADGWILWCYGGPGMLYSSLVDVRPYIGALKNADLIMEPTWVVQNFSVSISPDETQATVTWTTTEPTQSRIEYANASLFGATERYGDFGRPLYYKDIDYVGGTELEDQTPKTNHSFTIPITNQTQFRIQCTDANGVTLTSQPMSVLEASPP